MKEPSNVTETLEPKKRAMQSPNATVIEVKSRVLLILLPRFAVGLDGYSAESGTENDVSAEHLLGETRQRQLATLQVVSEPM